MIPDNTPKAICMRQTLPSSATFRGPRYMLAGPSDPLAQYMLAKIFVRFGPKREKDEKIG